MLFTLPDALVNTARKRLPLSASTVAGVVKLGLVAPTMLIQVTPASVLCCHCTVGEGTPLAAAVKVAVAGATTATSAGCSVMLGATGAGLTVSVAPLLVASGFTPLLATALKTAPLQPIGTAVSVRAALVAPATLAPVHTPLACTPLTRLAPLMRHWSAGAGVPVATTVKLTAAPAMIDCEIGWVVNKGAIGAGFTVSSAELLVTLPALLLTSTR